MKKFMALLATGLVIALSTTSVFAAESPALNDGVNPICPDTVMGSIDAGNNKVASVDIVDRSTEVDTPEEAKAYIDKIEADRGMVFIGAKVQAFANIDIKLEGVEISEDNPVYIPLSALGITDDEGPWRFVYNYNTETGKWEGLEISSDGVKFTNSSLVLVFTAEDYDWVEDESPSLNDEVSSICPDTVKNSADAGNNKILINESVVTDRSGEVDTFEEAKPYFDKIGADNGMVFIGAKVKSFANIDIKLEGVKVSKDNPVCIPLSALGITDGEGPYRFVYNLNAETGKWERVETIYHGDVEVAKFTHFSPVLAFTADGIEPRPQGSWYYDPAIDGPVNPATTTSPKTGVLPVAAFVATICLAGAAVCGKKVK